MPPFVNFVTSVSFIGKAMKLIKGFVSDFVFKLLNHLSFKLYVLNLSESMEAEDLPGLKVMVRELDDVLFRDVGNRIADSGK